MTIMRFPILFACLLLVFALALQVTASHYVLHERRSALNVLPRGELVPDDAVATFRIALKQSSLENADDYLLNISHPSSPHYGKLWSREDVRKMFAPALESTDAVRKWLTASGIEEMHESENKGWLSFTTTFGHAGSLLQSQYYEHVDPRSGAIRIACDEYSLPEQVSPHIDYITPGVVQSPPLEKKTIVRRDDQYHHRPPVWPMPHWPTPKPSWHHRPHWNPPPGSGSLSPDLQTCGFNMTPTCIRALYDLPGPGEVASSYSSGGSSLGVFELLYPYNQSDLNLFFKKFAPQVPQDTHPQLDLIEEARLNKKLLFPELDAEANIDLDILYSLTYPQTVSLYQVAPKYNHHEVLDRSPLALAVENLLDALDGSYCTAQERAAGQACGIYSSTNVISISYGASEVFYPESQQKRQCLEILKQGLQGVTFTVASGDYGVSDRPGIDPVNHRSTNGCLIPGNYNASTDHGHGFYTLLNGTVFNPIYPQSCPYVLSVGGTQLNTDDTVLDAESALEIPDLLFELLNETYPVTFSSSGGFSNYFSQPSYQESAVNAYFAQHDPGYPYYISDGKPFPSNIGANGGLYNRAGRGFPDVSANGANLLFYDGGILQPEWGTSLSTPIWASVITLINEKRSQHGKGPVGFVNPVLYANSYVLNDITNGTNPGCNTNGFAAVQGWDPITGLGTPNFPRLLELFLSFP